MYILENLFSFLPLPLCFFLLLFSSPTIYPFIDSKTPIRYWGNKSAAHIPPELFQYKSYRKKISLPTWCKIFTGIQLWGISWKSGPSGNAGQTMATAYWILQSPFFPGLHRAALWSHCIVHRACFTWTLKKFLRSLLPLMFE